MQIQISQEGCVNPLLCSVHMRLVLLFPFFLPMATAPDKRREVLSRKWEILIIWVKLRGCTLFFCFSGLGLSDLIVQNFFNRFNCSLWTALSWRVKVKECGTLNSILKDILHFWLFQDCAAERTTFYTYVCGKNPIEQWRPCSYRLWEVDPVVNNLFSHYKKLLYNFCLTNLDRYE